MATSNIRDKMSPVRATTRIGFDGDFEIMMKHTDYNLCPSNIPIMKKLIQLQFTETICYIQFVKVLLLWIRRRIQYKGIYKILIQRHNTVGFCTRKCHERDILRISSRTRRKNSKRRPFMWNAKKRNEKLTRALVAME